MVTECRTPGQIEIWPHNKEPTHDWMHTKCWPPMTTDIKIQQECVQEEAKRKEKGNQEENGRKQCNKWEEVISERLGDTTS